MKRARVVPTKIANGDGDTVMADSDVDIDAVVVVGDSEAEDVDDDDNGGGATDDKNDDGGVAADAAAAADEDEDDVGVTKTAPVGESHDDDEEEEDEDEDDDGGNIEGLVEELVKVKQEFMYQDDDDVVEVVDEVGEVDETDVQKFEEPNAVSATEAVDNSGVTLDTSNAMDNEDSLNLTIGEDEEKIFQDEVSEDVGCYRHRRLLSGRIIQDNMFIEQLIDFVVIFSFQIGIRCES